jgi:hypothetical protein
MSSTILRINNTCAPNATTSATAPAVTNATAAENMTIPIVNGTLPQVDVTLPKLNAT